MNGDDEDKQYKRMHAGIANNSIGSGSYISEMELSECSIFIRMEDAMVF